MPPEYGEHVEGIGYCTGVDEHGQARFSNNPPPRARNMDVRRPGSGTRLREDVEFRNDTPTTDELVQRARAAAFHPNPSMEKARRLRDSDRDEDRRAYRSLSPRMRMQVGNYEQDLAAFVAAGRTLPEGVRPPVDPDSAA